MRASFLYESGLSGTKTTRSKLRSDLDLAQALAWFSWIFVLDATKALVRGLVCAGLLSKSQGFDPLFEE